MDRRKAIRHGFIFVAAAVTGCGGGEASAPLAGPPPSPSPPVASGWTPSVPPLVVRSGTSFDLATTLPVGVTRGGQFGIDATGAALPVGMALSLTGMLSVGTAAVGTVAGVIFTYETP